MTIRSIARPVRRLARGATHALLTLLPLPAVLAASGEFNVYVVAPERKASPARRQLATAAA